MKNLFLVLGLIISSISFIHCDHAKSLISGENKGALTNKLSYPEGTTIETRFNVPEGYKRVVVSKHSFGEYLRNLPLKKHLSKVFLYNGDEKGNQNVHAAVVDLEIGKSDLQQCADAVMRLRAEYLFKEKRFDDIHFNFTSGFNALYTKWRDGFRINVQGNKVEWVQKAKVDSSYLVFRQYLDKVFTYAGTRSLSKELKQVANYSEMQIGDVFIIGGSPGHAVLIVDMAENTKTGEKLFMMVQSYMPAQEIHVLKNFQNEVYSPWYKLEENKTIKTPEWSFETNDLKRF